MYPPCVRDSVGHRWQADEQDAIPAIKELTADPRRETHGMMTHTRATKPIHSSLVIIWAITLLVITLIVIEFEKVKKWYWNSNTIDVYKIKKCPGIRYVYSSDLLIYILKLCIHTFVPLFKETINILWPFFPLKISWLLFHAVYRGSPHSLMVA